MFDADSPNYAVSKAHVDICPRFNRAVAWNGDIGRFDTSSVANMSYLYV